ncbi:MAG: sodium:calcium symporter [Omnitrophica WOR_2 bacterium RIFCSPLOWO2_12_FULL_51_24]|nr:MAG: sodium:calcium symporter [Omnitrophica WOR_2 bacterium RIFCSPHIGHO2_01_FULL_49_10]OGX35518.1 MAG: sodium:calcium symporter [Omnitrophica WOR_2 bacterium RIFCSPLOWO2_02_FULL_50_19]OGX43841.1 MAG: sodium:calcium symporter [Omnitrophica WOR_2 bacterium RIFCSPLOWO2_12_FULL_51_24]
MAEKKRQAWGSKLGVIMAVAGSAVGLGNFLRFPVQAASNGGGAFMIPYFVALLLLGIPLMWIEWSLGRYGGGFGHGTAPGIFHSLGQKNRFIKYFGVIGIFGPLVILIYYTYIESWTLAYSFFALTGKYAGATTQSQMQSFLHAFQGLENNQYFNSLQPAYVFFLITFFLNLFVIYYGIKGGIERLCKFAMPALFIFAALIAVRVLTLGAPNFTKPSWNSLNGLGFLWNPDFTSLRDPKVWLAAAGQIFFTLSVGIGVILTYASYLKKTDDVTLSGLTAVSLNEFAEIILGGSIVITAAYVFFGPIGAQDVAESGAFNLGFVTMPLIFERIPLGAIFGFLWFMMLFLAGITSSVSLAQPAVAFLEDEFNLDRKKAVWILGIVFFILCQPAIFFLGKGVVDELDFWGGTFCLVLFGTIETILFTWVFGIDKAWEEMHHGAEFRIPRIYKFIMRYITPVFLIIILGSFILSQDGREKILMANVSEADRPYVLGIRSLLIGCIAVLGVLVKLAWKRRKLSGTHGGKR